MKRFRVHLTSVVSTSVEVEVDLSLLGEDDDVTEAAIDQAAQKNRASLCHQCARHIDMGGEWIAGNWKPEESAAAIAENVEEL